MKNKTSRVNKMKLKKAIVASLAIFILLAFTKMYGTRHLTL